MQTIDARFASGAYAREDLAQLERLNAELEHLAYDPAAHEALREKLSQLAEAETRQLHLQQAKSDLLTLNDQRRELTRQQATLRETLTSCRFALTEQQELRDISERLERLDYQPEQHNLLRRRLQEQQDVERRYAQLRNRPPAPHRDARRPPGSRSHTSSRRFGNQGTRRRPSAV